MTFIELREFKAVETIEKKERISLIVKYSMDSHLLFFKDHTFQHIARSSPVPLFEGRLNFLATHYMESGGEGSVVVSGVGKDKSMWCSVIDIEDNYRVESRQIENIQPQPSTKYHLYEPDPQDGSLFIIRVMVNIENGLAIAVYDFWRDLWCEQMIALPSKFLNYFIINTSLCNSLYNEPNDLSCHSFVLLALGQRFDSINYSKVKFCHEGTVQATLKLKFIITREIKLKKTFIISAAMQCDESRLFVVGNSVQDQLSQERSTAFLSINTTVLENNDPQSVEISCVQLVGESGRFLLVRKWVGCFGGNLVVIVGGDGGKAGLAMFSPIQQRLFFECQQAGQYRLSVQKDCYFSYKLQFQLFFEKIKNSPSKISYTLIKIYNKQHHYQHLLKRAFPSLSPFFLKEVFGLL